MAITFLLLLVLVQVATAMTARSAADAAVASAARQASLPGVDMERTRANLARAIEAMVPGADDIDVDLRRTRHASTASASFRWTPPGPVLSTVRISVRSEVPRVRAP